MRETLIFALVALVSEAVVPSLVQYVSERREAAKAVAEQPAAAEEAEPEEEPEAAEASEPADEDALERLQEENRLLKELVAEKELALRRAKDE